MTLGSLPNKSGLDLILFASWHAAHWTEMWAGLKEVSENQHDNQRLKAILFCAAVRNKRPSVTKGKHLNKDLPI